MEEAAEIMRFHPGIVLISENPITWQGFLVVDASLGVAVDMTLTVPYYPQLTEATLLFGQSISLLHATGFSDKIIVILENATTVSSLLFQLKRVVANLLKEKFGSRSSGTMTNYQGGLVEEIGEALRSDSSVKLSASSGLKAVKLSLDNVNVTLRRDAASNSWRVLSSDLPEVSWLEPFEFNLGSLRSAMAELQRRMYIFTDVWNLLNQIDETCWVVDPTEPKPYHLYRRVKLSPSLSAHITVDPMNSSELPDIKLLGSNAEVAKYRNIMSSNLLKWDSERSITDNLKILLDIDELPQPPATRNSKDENAIVEDEECCICFAMELEDHTPVLLPVEICNNDKCRKHFHTLCLRQWLQAIAVNQVSFDRIHGKCPNCNSDISCALT